MEAGRKRIIIVDDDRTSLLVAKNALTPKYDVLTASSGHKLLGLLEKVIPDLLLLDVEMPEMDGYEVIKILKSTEKTAHIPVVFLTARIDSQSEIRGLSLGAVDYIFKPFSQELLLKHIELHLLLEAQKQELKRYSTDLEGEVRRKTQTVFKLQNTILKTVADLVEYRDSVTGGHIERTQNYLRLLVSLLLKHGVYKEELLSWDIDCFVMSSQLHDVGKISIKDSILLKQGKLTGEEFTEMKDHTVIGRSIIERIVSGTEECAFLEHASIMAYSHHEKWDGTGYPLGLKGEEIPLEGRLMAFIDVYDALTNDRPYKRAYTPKEAMEIIREGIGTHFDPLVGEIFVSHADEFARCGGAGAGPAQAPKKTSETQCASPLSFPLNADRN